MIGKEYSFTEAFDTDMGSKGRTNDEGFADHVNPGYCRKHHHKPVIECNSPRDSLDEKSE